MQIQIKNKQFCHQNVVFYSFFCRKNYKSGIFVFAEIRKINSLNNYIKS